MRRGIAIIPARGGSKRLKNKNIIEINGKPLIHYTMDVVNKVFRNVIVCSDSDDILRIAREHLSQPSIVSLPESTTTDDSTVLDSIKYLAFNTQHLEGYDFIGMFLPTCPLRRLIDVESAINSLKESHDGLVSITDYDFPPQLGLCQDRYGFIHCTDHRLPWLTGSTRSQNYTGIFRPNGAIYLRWLEAFKSNPNFFAGNVFGFKMPKQYSLDIDTIEDVQQIEAYLQRS